MSNISNLNRFTQIQNDINIGRSRFNLSHGHKMTMNSGELTPVDCQEILPGDTIEVDLKSVIRSITPAVPVMDDSYVDFYSFFVPSRLCCQHEKDWQAIMGENIDGYWAQSQEYTIENTGNYIGLDAPIFPGSALNHLGLPIKDRSTQYQKVSNLPIRGYCKIWNEYFRDQNTQAPINVDNRYDFVGNNGYADLYKKCLPVNKFHGLFTSCLPAPQKGPSTLIPLLGSAPVVAGNPTELTKSDHSVTMVKAGTTATVGNVGFYVDGNGKLFGKQNSSFSPVDGTDMVPGNLIADLSKATGASINQLRLSFAIQRMLEKDARSGSRYIESIKAFFGVTIADGVAQRPQYLGGMRAPLTISQVLQTSETTDKSPMGATGAFSNSYLESKVVPLTSFNEYGYLYIFAIVRPVQSYSQGLPKMWQKNRRFDFYNPVFAHIGEQPIYKKEIYLGDSTDESVFGYQEAWAEHRYIPTSVTGYLAPNAKDNILGKWTYTNKFTASPVLNSDFMKQSNTQIGNTFAVASDTFNYQYICDFYLEEFATRAMPVYSTPGLLDHF